MDAFQGLTLPTKYEKCFLQKTLAMVSAELYKTAIKLSECSADW